MPEAVVEQLGRRAYVQHNIHCMGYKSTEFTFCDMYVEKDPAVRDVKEQRDRQIDTSFN